jgi:hypothetical protein
MTNFCRQPQLEAALIIVYHLFNILKQRFSRKNLLFFEVYASGSFINFNLIN